jgi:hypothetical protein
MYSQNEKLLKEGWCIRSRERGGMIGGGVLFPPHSPRTTIKLLSYSSLPPRKAVRREPPLSVRRRREATQELSASPGQSSAHAVHEDVANAHAGDGRRDSSQARLVIVEARYHDPDVGGRVVAAAWE